MKKINNLLIASISSFALFSCGNGSATSDNPPPPDPKKPDIVVVNDVKKSGMVFKVPEASLNQIRSIALYNENASSKSINVSSSIALTDTQAALTSSVGVMPYDRYWESTEVTPHPELFCEDPANAELVANAARLGGYKKTHRISKIHDATIPTYYQDFGIEPLYTVEFSDSGDTVSISRPDLVGKNDDYAFFLSSIYGLFVLDHTAMPETKPIVSCGMPIPGNAKNFLVVGDNIIVLTQSFDQRHSGLIKLSIVNNVPVVVESRVFENKQILDARLFNNTLAIYFKNYVPDTTTSTQSNLSPTTLLQASSPAYDDSDAYYFEEINRELNIIKPLNGLETVFTEILEKEGYENEFNDPQIDTTPEATRRYSYFNDFLSASDEYLIISETQRESVFSHYEQASYRRCENWETNTFEDSHTNCHTLWKTIPNPAYDASKLSKQSGVLDCQGKLFDCIKTELPTVSKTITIAEGQQCDTYTHEHQDTFCSSYKNITYQVPRFNRHLNTNFTVYRFADEEFIKLEDKLINIDTVNQTISSTENNFKVAGQVYKHDHMAFNDGIFSVINQGVNGQLKLNTYAIAGNAAASVGELILTQTGKKWHARDLTALFTQSNLYLSNQSSHWNESLQKSVLENVSLADPLRPRSVNNFVIPTKLDQFAFMDDVLVGIGSTYLMYANTQRRFGTVMAFDAPIEGGEVSEDDNSSILGSDYQYFSSLMKNDDQVLHVDTENKRIIIPYYVQNPLNADDNLFDSANRVSLFTLENNTMIEEKTFNVEQPVIRSLSINKDSALAFSNQSIYAMTRDIEWKKETLVNGEIPYAVYFLQNVLAQAFVYDNAMHYSVSLVNSPDSPTAETFGEIKLPKPMSTQCERKHLYFDKDRILYVTEKPNTYFNPYDCPDTWEETELEFTGYQMGIDGFSSIQNQAILRDLYQQIKWDLQCVLEPEKTMYGSSLLLTDEHDTSNMICYPRDDFHRIQREKNEY